MAAKNSSNLLEDIFIIVVILALFAIGGFVLTLKIPFWSMFLGIAAIQIGIVISIFSFDILSRKSGKTITKDYKAIPCLVCGNVDFVPKYKRTTICDNCQMRIAKAAKSFLVVMLSLISLTSVLYLFTFQQDIRKKAKELTGVYRCKEGYWQPRVCACGQTFGDICGEAGQKRECADGILYCCEKDKSPDNWNCTEIGDM